IAYEPDVYAAYELAHYAGELSVVCSASRSLAQHFRAVWALYFEETHISARRGFGGREGNVHCIRRTLFVREIFSHWHCEPQLCCCFLGLLHWPYGFGTLHGTSATCHAAASR